MTERLEDRLTRLERERQEADRQYNDALTALDRALQSAPAFPASPPPYDATKLPDINHAWDILAGGPPPVDGSLKGRLRGFIWGLVGPVLGGQRQFNAALVEHLNRNAAAHQTAQEALDRLIGVAAQQIEGHLQFQSHLIQLLQTVTLYIDTKDRSVAGQIEVLNGGLAAIADDWLKHWESLKSREHRFANRVSTTDASLQDVRATATLAQQTALSLKREMEKILTGTPGTPGTPGTRNELTLANIQATGSAFMVPGVPGVPGVPDLDAFKYVGFEDAFRGSQVEIRRRLVEYLPKFEGLSDVLDVGCGRGEFLDLLRERGINARGLDLNDAMVEESRARGLDVVRADALGYLSDLPDASLGGIFSAQVVEHLPPDYLMKLIEVAGHKLRAGGLIVLETINPTCWVAFFESYIRDLTHVRPLHPETLQYLLRVSGFHNVTVEFTSPIADFERLQAVPRPLGDVLPELLDLVDTSNANIEKLNARMFTFQDYAAIGRR